MASTSFDPREYVQWVQRSLNRLLEISLVVDGDDRSAPYRSAVKEFNRLYLHRDFDGVDEKTQNALIAANENDWRYVMWLQSALCRALSKPPMQSAPAGDLMMNSATRQLVSFFQRTQDGLDSDGFVGFRTEVALMAATGTVAPGSTGSDADAFIDQSGHPTAGAYYTLFPDEPVLPSGTVHCRTVKELSAMTVSSLLEAILASKAENVLISCHGNPKGLSIPLIEGTDIELGSFVSELLAQWRDGKQSEEVMVNTLKWDTWPLRPLAAFQDRVKQIGKRKLGRVELRSCNTGADVDTLKNLRQFFNCKSLTAPTVLDGYAPIDPGSPTISPGDWSEFRKKHPVRLEEGSPPDRFAIAHRVSPGNKLTFSAITESPKGLRNFIDGHFVVPKTFRAGPPIPGHALIPPGKAIFPADSEYVSHLRKVNAGE